MRYFDFEKEGDMWVSVVEQTLGCETWHEGGCSRGGERVMYWILAHLPGKSVYLSRESQHKLTISTGKHEGRTLFTSELSDEFIPIVRRLAALECRRRNIVKKGLEPLAPEERLVARTLGELEPSRLALEQEVNRIFRQFYEYQGGCQKVDRAARRKYQVQA